MKVRIIVMGLVLVFVSSSAFALIGPPTAGLEKGQWSLGGNYQYSSQDLDRIKVDYVETGEEDGTPYVDVDTYKLDIKDLNINRYYVQFGYGLKDTWEVFGQLGMVDIEAKYREVGDSEWNNDKFDTEILYGLGTKYTFAKKEKYDLGVALQANMTNPSWSDYYTYTEPGYTETGKETIDIDILDITIAVGPTIKMEGWKLYGGALYELLMTDHNIKTVGSWVGGTTGTFTCKDKGDTDVHNYGAYIGAQFSISNKYDVRVEGMGTNNGWGIGAGIEVPF